MTDPQIMDLLKRMDTVRAQMRAELGLRVGQELKTDEEQQAWSERVNAWLKERTGFTMLEIKHILSVEIQNENFAVALLSVLGVADKQAVKEIERAAAWFALGATAALIKRREHERVESLN